MLPSILHLPLPPLLSLPPTPFLCLSIALPGHNCRLIFSFCCPAALCALLLLLLALQFINSQQPQPEPCTMPCYTLLLPLPFSPPFPRLFSLLSFARPLRAALLAAFHMRFPYCCRYVICSESAAATAAAAALSQLPHLLPLALPLPPLPTASAGLAADFNEPPPLCFTSVNRLSLMADLSCSSVAKCQRKAEVNSRRRRATGCKGAGKMLSRGGRVSTAGRGALLRFVLYIFISGNQSA